MVRTRAASFEGEPALGRHPRTWRSLRESFVMHSPGATASLKWITNRTEPPTLYIDDSTIMQEVKDLCKLRRGDHCIVGLNPIRKVFWLIDKMVTWFASWEILRLYHHFVVYDDVVAISDEGVPLTADGAPARICEYSNTPGGALRQIAAKGLADLWYHPAPFQKLPLHDYQEGRQTYGIFRVAEREPLTDEQRDKIVERMDALTKSYEPYSVFFRNCEHAAFRLDAAVGGRWASPQVPWMFWNAFRFLCQLVGVFFLVNLALPEAVSAGRMAGLITGYHIFATLPVVLQVMAQLARSVMAITAARRRSLDEAAFYHLLYKEVGRAVVVGILAVIILALMPRMVWDTSFVAIASLLVIFAYAIANMLFSFMAQATIRIMIKHGTGVLVPVATTDFDDGFGSPRSSFDDGFESPRRPSIGIGKEAMDERDRVRRAEAEAEAEAGAGVGEAEGETDDRRRNGFGANTTQRQRSRRRRRRRNNRT